MSKYLRLFETTADYTAAESTLVKPNVSLIEETNKVEYNPYIPPPSITIVYKGDGDSATRIITKNIDGFGTVYNLDESSIVNMTLDDNKVSFDDFEVVNIGEYGAVGNVYTYVFGDTNEHVLKIWSTTTTMFKFTATTGGPGISSAADFSSIKSIRISDTITSIPWGNFYGCSGLLSINIPNTVTTINGYTFYRCSSLTSITIPNSVTSIGEGAFYNCSSLTSVTIPNSVTSIGNNAFWSCTNLTSITIPNSITSIGGGAFCECSSLTSINIPNSVTSIGTYAFSGCSSLTSIAVEDGNTKYDSRDNCNAIIEITTNILVAGCKSTVIPNSVTGIGYSAFSDCRNLTSINIPNSVTSIDTHAFGGCSSLTSITISDSVTSIGIQAFINCTNLTSITIPNSITSIGMNAFYQCSSLLNVTVEATTPPSLGSYVFSTNVSGRKIYVPAASVNTYKSASGWRDYASDIEAIATT